MAIKSSMGEQERKRDEVEEQVDDNHNQKGSIHDIQIIDLGDKKGEDGDIDYEGNENDDEKLSEHWEKHWNDEQ